MDFYNRPVTKTFRRNKMEQRIITIVMAIIRLFCLGTGIAHAAPSGGTYYVNDKMITSTLKQTRRKVYDRDGDSKVNCSDGRHSGRCGPSASLAVRP